MKQRYRSGASSVKSTNREKNQWDLYSSQVRWPHEGPCLTEHGGWFHLACLRDVVPVVLDEESFAHIDSVVRLFHLYLASLYFIGRRHQLCCI